MLVGARGMKKRQGTNLGTVGRFLGVWIVMMAAMMMPSVSPTVALYARMTKQRSPVAPVVFFFFQAEDGIRDGTVTGVQTCALPICAADYVHKILLGATPG